jgi:hypothetical protein
MAGRVKADCGANWIEQSSHNARFVLVAREPHCDAILGGRDRILSSEINATSPTGTSHARSAQEAQIVPFGQAVDRHAQELDIIEFAGPAGKKRSQRLDILAELSRPSALAKSYVHTFVGRNSPPCVPGLLALCREIKQERLIILLRLGRPRAQPRPRPLSPRAVYIKASSLLTLRLRWPRPVRRRRLILSPKKHKHLEQAIDEAKKAMPTPLRLTPKPHSEQVK